MLTFEPHPREYFAALAAGTLALRASAPARICTLRDKLDALAARGVDRVCVAHFNASLAALPPERFIDEMLVEGLHARYLLIGDDFRFGARRRGDFAMLEQAASPARLRAGADRHHQPRRRAHLELGGTRGARRRRLPRVRELLGRPYFISGHVVHGRKLGRTIGFPTLNLPIPFDRPAVSGVFVVRVHGLASDPVAGVASLGTRPAVERDGRLLLEVHLFDFDADIYGRLVRVEFLHKLRDEAHFDSIALLTAQIERDAQAARAWFSADRAGNRPD